ncbi:MAG: YciI family protein [Flavipsychrobacter sp.]|nr:YciI family protein [Flavipsychrobacter sp.]
MKEFVLLFQNAPAGDNKPSPEQMQAMMKEWDNYMGSIAAQGKYVSGSRLGGEGKTLKPGNVVTDGPYAEIKEILGGFIIVKADSLNDAFELAYGCPILTVGGYVEVRPVIGTNE